MQRLIVIGASNVSRAFGPLLATARGLWDGPLEVIAAHGHGRSYGAAWSRVLARKLPGILHSGLWPAIQNQTSAPAALVTDIGNDILYEFPVATIADWVERCFDRLLEVDARTVVVALPVENIRGLSSARYKFFRNLFMPGCSLSLAETSSRALVLDERLRALALARDMTLVEQQSEWYGLDPIHIRRRDYPRAWRTILSPLCEGLGKATFHREKRLESWYLRTRLPERVKWFGKLFNTAQPSARLRDGTTISLY
jgi:hypothetical protein